MTSFLILLSGAREEVLKQCPTERVKFQSLGWSILITSTMATVSMWFALSSVLGANPVLALVPALAWGLIIMGIDRWLVTSIPPSGSRRFLLALPRLVLAILLGTIISTPLVLRIFQSEINKQSSVIKEQRESAYLTSLSHSSVNKQVNYWNGRVANLQKVIDSGGSVPVNPATDPVVINLTKQLTAERALEQKYYQQWQCQLYGGQGCTVKGNGPLARASENNYDKAVAQVATYMSEIQARQKTLTANNATANQRRLSQAQTALPEAQQQLTIAQNRLEQLRQNFDTTNKNTNGLLIRLEALGQLTGKDGTLGAARFLIFLLFLTIECLPVTVKLMQRTGNYDRILLIEQERELKEARRKDRIKSRGHLQPVTNFDPAPLDHSVIREIWQNPARSAERSAPDVHVPAAPADETEENLLLDDSALREMPDIDNAANATWQGGTGIELNWPDGEL